VELHKTKPPSGEANKEWLTAERTHNGHRLLLRRPRVVDIKTLAPKFPTLATMTHHLDVVTSDGLPERSYNDTLTELDHTIATALDSDKGVIVLIETFSGERNYYFYIAGNVNVSETLTLIKERYALARLSCETKSDPNWRFLKQYGADFF